MVSRASCLRACAVAGAAVCLAAGGALAHAQPNAGGWRVIASEGVAVRVPRDWQRITPAPPGPVTDPVTVLVVGTHGVRAKPSACQIASYRIPARGAVVVIVEWRTMGVGGSTARRELERMRVRPRAFECYGGPGAAALVRLHGRPFQVNVLLGRAVTKQRIADALRVARSIAAEPR